MTGRSLATLLVLALAASAAHQWWQGASERRGLERLASLAQPGDIRMLSSETCAHCDAARRTMKSHGVRFDECLIERDRDCRALYEATQVRGTPTLIVRGVPQLGFQVPRLLEALEARG
jgi:glutaredoxin